MDSFLYSSFYRSSATYVPLPQTLHRYHFSHSQQKLIIFHRINGYIILLLLLGGVIGAVIITRHAFGGDISTQAASGATSLATTVAAILAYYNIKRLQIDQHRKWMLRTIFYMASIITVRIIMVIGMVIIAKIGTYNTVCTPCLVYTFLIRLLITIESRSGIVTS